MEPYRLYWAMDRRLMEPISFVNGGKGIKLNKLYKLYKLNKLIKQNKQNKQIGKIKSQKIVCSK